MRAIALLSTALIIIATASPHATASQRSETGVRGRLGSMFGSASRESHGDTVAIAAGLRPLRERSLPTGSRELRVWIGGGITIPEDLYRIRVDDGKVTGQWIRYWDRKNRYEWLSKVSQSAMMRYSLDGTCDRIGTAGNVDACVTRFTKPPDWESMLRRLETDSVWTLLDQSAMPRDSIIVFDGYAISVEARDGANYRYFGYVNPDAHANAGARHAAAIAKSFAVLWPLAAPSKQRKVYRGRFTGDDGHYALAICRDTTKWGLDGDLSPLKPIRRDGTPDSLSDTIRVAYAEVRGMKAFPGLAKQWHSPYPEVIEVDSVLVVRPWRAEECH